MVTMCSGVVWPEVVVLPVPHIKGYSNPSSRISRRYIGLRPRSGFLAPPLPGRDARKQSGRESASYASGCRSSADPARILWPPTLQAPGWTRYGIAGNTVRTGASVLETAGTSHSAKIFCATDKSVPWCLGKKIYSVPGLKDYRVLMFPVCAGDGGIQSSLTISEQPAFVGNVAGNGLDSRQF